MLIDSTDLRAFDGEPVDEQGSRPITCCGDTLTASHLEGVVALTCAECGQDIALITVPEREPGFTYNGRSA